MDCRSVFVTTLIFIRLNLGFGQGEGTLAPRICAQDDPGCSGIRIEPSGDPGYVDCISNPSKNPAECLVKVAKSESDETVDPFVACPTDPILKSGLSMQDISLQASLLGPFLICRRQIALF